MITCFIMRCNTWTQCSWLYHINWMSLNNKFFNQVTCYSSFGFQNVTYCFPTRNRLTACASIRILAHVLLSGSTCPLQSTARSYSNIGAPYAYRCTHCSGYIQHKAYVGYNAPHPLHRYSTGSAKVPTSIRVCAHLCSSAESHNLTFISEQSRHFAQDWVCIQFADTFTFS